MSAPCVARIGDRWEASKGLFELLTVAETLGEFGFLVVSAEDPEPFQVLGDGPFYSNADLRRLIEALRARPDVSLALSILNYRVQAAE